ncbi:MAG: hypothetical protein A2X49_10395 [Lentisphaerae bacterium GWF2_52_8]|nr:MAG: hypothetical protein A2X49_10395 [Lentisphaerae bacterium GWF2_52_8]
MKVPINQFEDGCVIGDFVIKARLGEGSIGAVYRATQISLDRTVALKILSPEYTNAKGVSDFLREARAAAKLSHVNLVQALAVGEEDGICYMAMTYIKGETLKARMKREKNIPVDEALHIIQQVGEALYYAWDESGIIHRDVKPDNIMITDDGIVKLTDLGLAMHHAEWREDMEISGSPSYMSPEQFTGEKLDTRSDIYSMGVTLYQLLTGVLPFNGDTVRTVARQHFEQEPVSLTKLNPKIPHKVALLVKKMIAKSQEERFADMEELLYNIWTIRQKTAPNKDMVPDVHTISMKRLDYEVQHESIKEQQTAKKQAIEQKKQSSAIYTVLLLLLPVFAIILLVMVLNANQKSKRIELMKQQQSYLSKIFAEKNVERQFVLAEGKRVLAQFGVPQSPDEEALLYKMQTSLSNYENRALQSDLASFVEAQKKLQEDFTALREKQAAEAKKPKRDDSKEKELELEGAKLKQHLQDLQSSINNVKNENNALRKQLEKQVSEAEEAWRNNLLLKVYNLVGQARLKEASALLELETAKADPKNAEWLAAKKAWIERLAKILSSLTESGVKAAGLVIENECTLISINNGRISYKDPSGTIKDSIWTELSMDSAAAIAQKMAKTLKDEEVRADILALKGNFSEASRLLPEDQDFKVAARMLWQQALDNLKYLSLADRKKATAKAQALLKQAEGSPDYEKVKTELAPFLSFE